MVVVYKEHELRVIVGCWSSREWVGLYSGWHDALCRGINTLGSDGKHRLDCV